MVNVRMPLWYFYLHVISSCVRSVRNTPYFFTIVDNRIALLSYLELFPQIPDEQKYSLFVDVYCRSEYGFSGLPFENIKGIMKYRPVLLMNESMREMIDNNGYITIYRGVGECSTPIGKALSWTTDYQTALFFATRFRLDGNIYKAKVHKDKVIAYITSRNESEILVFPSDIEGLLDTQQIATSNILNALKEQEYISIYHYFRELILHEDYFEPDGIHGLLHVKRVLFRCLTMCYYENLSVEDMNILIQAALYHDIGRINNLEDPKHGFLSWKKAERLGKINEKDSEEVNIIKFIIENHCISDKKALLRIGDYTISDTKRAIMLYEIFKDCDGLDRVRIQDLNPEYFRRKISHRLTVAAVQFLTGIQ